MATKKKAPKKSQKKNTPKKRRSPFEPEIPDTLPPIDPNNPPWSPKPETYPPVGSPMPMELLQRLEAAVGFRNDPIAHMSARSQMIANEPYNRQAFERYATALKNWYGNRRADGSNPYQEPPSPVPYYRVADLRTLVALTQGGIPVPYQPQEVNYNQITYPPQPKPVDWYSLVEPHLSRLQNS
jgi:hypothetical protein